MKLFSPYLILFSLIFLKTSECQVQQEWAVRYNGTGDYLDGAVSVAYDVLGSVYVTGYVSLDNGGLNEDYETIKYNRVGVQMWEARYNGPDSSGDRAQSIAVDNSGNVYVTGTAKSVSNGNDITTVKYNSNGVQQWVAIEDGTAHGNDAGIKVLTDNSGNVYVGGYQYRGAAGGSSNDFVVIKYNSSGVLQWQVFYNGPNSNDLLTCMVMDNFGNIYVGGNSGSTSSGIADYVCVKYNSNGTQEWAMSYNGPGNNNDQPISIAVDNQGNVFITGTSMGSGTGIDYATIKYNSSGAQQWVSRYNYANSFDQAVSIAVDTLGNSYVTGYSTASTTAFYDFATVKYNSAGVEQWVVRYNAPNNGTDVPGALVLDKYMNLYITGYSSTTATANEITTLKYNSNGVQQWVINYNYLGIYRNVGKDIKVDNTGAVFVTGHSYHDLINADFITIKYSQPPSSINTISNEIPEKFSLSQNYPNPFNPVTNIEFSLPEKSLVTLKIFDVTGKQVKELTNEVLSAGKYRYDFNAESLPSGTYFYKLETEKHSEIKKMILLK